MNSNSNITIIIKKISIKYMIFDTFHIMGYIVFLSYLIINIQIWNDIFNTIYITLKFLFF
jgi:hypothetical protein